MKTVEVNGYRLAVSNPFPPIPVRDFDWVAYDDDLGAESSPYGYGRTEQEAIDNFFEVLEDMA